jgi:hypothetical protein
MNINKWTLGLVAAGVVSLGSVAQAEEASEHLMTAVSGTQISGYVSTSAMWKPGTGIGALPGRSFHDGAAKQDGFNLDVIDLTISKSLDESEWAAGYKAELWFGPDAAAYGSSSTAINASDMNIRQAYVELRAPVGNGLDFKVGTFDTLIGYEVSNHDGNPNIGRSYGWFIEPTSHTGILASYAVTDFLSLSAGVVNSALANQINVRAAGATAVESDKSYTAAAFLTAPDDWGFLSGATLALGFVDNTTGANFAGGTADEMSYYAGLALPLPIEGWSIGAAWDYRGASESSNGANDAYYANAVALYLSAGVTEKLTLNLRADYATGTGAVAGNIFGVAATAGDNDPGSKLFAVTTTVDYSLWENVLTRLEVRWDTSLTNDRPYGAPTADEKNALTIAANVIYKF